jgi:hypothetical protein
VGDRSLDWAKCRLSPDPPLSLWRQLYSARYKIPREMKRRWSSIVQSFRYSPNVATSGATDSKTSPSSFLSPIAWGQALISGARP